MNRLTIRFAAKRFALVGFLTFVILLTGCASSVKILKPQDGESLRQPVLFQVKLHQDADPNTLQVKLDGFNITQEFSNPQAGSVCSSPPQDMIRLNRAHKLFAHAEWSSPKPFSTTSVTHEFRAPRVALKFLVEPGHDAFFPGSDYSCLRLRPGYTLSARIETAYQPGTDVTVTITPENSTPTNNIVILNSAAPGDAISVTIPALGRWSQDFSIRLNAEGNVTLVVEANGYERQENRLCLINF